MLELADYVGGLSRQGTWAGLGQYAVEHAFAEDPAVRALNAYVQEWATFNSGLGRPDFSKFVSEDFSSVMLASCPVIFLGTNDWATVRFRSASELDESVKKWSGHMERLVAGVKSPVPVGLVVVPEKDVVIRHLSGAHEELRELDEAMDRLLNAVRRLGVSACTLGADYAPPDPRVVNYEYFDSHLLSRDYVNLFTALMKELGLSSQAAQRAWRLQPEERVGDLARKLSASEIVSHYLFVDCENSGVEQDGGDETFRDPLRETFQSFRNSDAVIDARVAVFGDSHCSIYAERKLSYMLANTFAYAEFHWDPLSVNRQNLNVEADFVVLEISQRFLF